MAMEDGGPCAARITIVDGGPYVVEGGPRLTRRWPAETAAGEPMEWDPVGGGADYPERERFALCRCGQSANKPYCDGTHASVGFEGTLTADRSSGEQRRERHEGSGVVMTDDTTLCADGGFCGTARTNVWAMIGDAADPETRARLRRMVSMCPSGRLQLLDGAGDPIEPEYNPSIATVKDGPLWVRGGIPVSAADGFAYEARNRQTLCRCGGSQNKPFCDGAHKSVGFSAE